MHIYAAAGAAFLLAVLWFDLMFDVQVRRHSHTTLPQDVLASISSYYRRVTIHATPMNRLVSLIMLLTLAAIIAEIVENRNALWLEWSSLACALAAIGLAGFRTVRNAMRLGREKDSAEAQSQLARSVYRDHLFCVAAIGLLEGLQLAAR
jgi:hypothetical protein